MRAFEVYLYDRKLCVAGIAEAGVVSSIVTWVTGPNPEKPEDMELRIGGLVSRTDTHVDWAHRVLKEGDEVRIVACEKGRASKPKATRSETARSRRKREIDYLKRLSKELGYELRRK
jgi:hypothetical protein